MKHRNLSFLLFVLSGCAMTHPGIIGMSDKKDNQLFVSVQENRDLSDDFYGFFEYTFENRSKEWKRIKVVHAGFPDFENHVLVNNDLVAWVEGAELKLKKYRYNMALLTGGIAAVGGVIAATSNNMNTKVAGASVMITSVTTGAVLTTQDTRNDGQRGLHGSVNVPKTHIFVPFSVSPQSFVRRWVVLKTPKNKSRRKRVLLTNIELGDGKEKMEIKFKRGQLSEQKQEEVIRFRRPPNRL